MSQVLGSKPKITTKMEGLIHAWVAEKGLSRAHNDGDVQAVERKIKGEFPSRDVPLTEAQVLDYLFPGDASDVATSATRKLATVVARLTQHAAAKTVSVPKDVAALIFQIGRHFYGLAQKGYKMPTNLGYWLLPRYEETVNEDLAISMAESDIQNLRDLSVAWAELSESAHYLPDDMDKAKAKAAMLKYSKAFAASADASQTAGEVVCTRINGLLASVRKVVSQHLVTKDTKFTYADSDILGSFKDKPGIRFSIEYRRDKTKDGFFVRGTKPRLHMMAWGKGVDVETAVDINVPDAEFRKAFTDWIQSVSGSSKGAQKQIEQLKAKDRKLTAGEVRLFAGLFTISNMGQLQHIKLVGDSLKVETIFGKEAVPVLSEKDRYAAGDYLFYWFQQAVAGDADMTDEFDGWLKDMKPYKLSKVADTWHDMLPLCLYLAGV